jgi:hypothetical protein
MCDTIDGISPCEVELEPEVREWLEGLDDQRWAQAMFHLDLLEERGALLGEPHTRQLDGKLRELRIIMLTVFTKTKMHETAQVERAAAAMARCQREGHTTDEGEEG